MIFLADILSSIVLCLAPLLSFISLSQARIHYPSATGDIFNMTKCYCEAAQPFLDPPPGPADEDPEWTYGEFGAPDRFGHYYRFDYYNFHNDEVYTLAWTCSSTDVSAKNDHFPVCWNERRAMGKCLVQKDGNQFCYTVEPEQLGWTDSQLEHYSLNGQRRGLPKYANMYLAPVECETYCKDKVGGKIVAQDEVGSFNKTWHGFDKTSQVISELRSYAHTDDMCDGCK